MKNIFKKTAGVILTASIICSFITAGCTAPNNEDSESEDTYSTKNQETLGLELADEVYTIDDSQSSDYGITADVTYKNLISLETSKVSEQDGFEGFADDTVVEIYDIKVNYSTIEYGEEVIKTTDDYKVCGDMIVSIPCDIPDLNVLRANEGETGGDVYAQYVDGCYIFNVNFLGSFMLSTEPSHCPELPKKYNMIEQTLVDPRTGVQVSGLIPEGALLYTTIDNVDTSSLLMEEDMPNFPKYDFPLPSLKEIYTKTKSDSQTYNYSVNNSGMVVVDVVFVMEHEIYEFDSDLTVTLPLDYYKVLENCEFPELEDLESSEVDISAFDSPGDEYYYDGSYYTYEDYVEMMDLIDTDHIAKVFQLNPRTSNLKEIEVLTKTGGEEKFEFKTNCTGSGTFFVSNKRLMKDFVWVYGWSYDDLETLDDN